MSGQRKALIIANGEYEQEALRNLPAPAADAEALSRVLSDPQIGNFTVQVVRNEPSHVIEAQIEDLFSDSRTDDVLLMHYSGHGLKSAGGELFFAASNTLPNRLRATAVPADFVQQCMRDSRSRSIVVLLDCCYAGAFPQGVKVRATGDVHVLDNFPREKSGGRGRAVITASNAMEYAFEGDRLADDQHRLPSVFTTALVEGLATGDADQDEDGWVSLDELYDYVLDKVHDQNPHQTPSRQVDLEGDLYLARSRRLQPNQDRVTQQLTGCGLANAFRIPRDNFSRLERVRELINQEAGTGRPLRLAASSGFSYLSPNGAVWADAGLGQLITAGVMDIVAVLESPFSDFALTRALANGVDHHHWQEKQTPENLINLLQHPNVTIRVTDRSVNCSLFLTGQAVYYDPYLWALPYPGARAENNFWVLEFTRGEDGDRDCYALLEKHFDFLLSYSVPLEEVLHAPANGSQCPHGKEFFDFFMTDHQAALNRYRTLTREFTKKVQRLRRDNHGPVGPR